MLMIATAYGFKLTNEFGKFYKKYAPLRKLGIDFESSDFCTECSSAEEPQLVLGFSIRVNKNMDLNNIHQEWLKFYEALPVELKNAIEEVKKENPKDVEPDIQIMVGSY